MTLRRLDIMANATDSEVIENVLQNARENGSLYTVTKERLLAFFKYFIVYDDADPIFSTFSEYRTSAYTSLVAAKRAETASKRAERESTHQAAQDADDAADVERLRAAIQSHKLKVHEDSEIIVFDYHKLRRTVNELNRQLNTAHAHLLQHGIDISDANIKKHKHTVRATFRRLR